MYRFPNPVGRLKLVRPNALSGLLYLIAAVRTSLGLFREVRPDALLVHWVLPTGPAGAIVARRLGVPLFVWAHGSDLETYAARGRLFRLLARWVLAPADKVFAVSQSLASKARSLGARDVTCLPMGVARVFKEGEAPAERPVPFTSLFVGDLIPGKGVRVALNAWRLLGPGRTIRHVFVGSGPLRPEVERAGHKVIQGATARQVADLLDRSHVFVLPSRSEGVPLSLLEALCRGVPVVATAVGGIPEWVVDGREGLLLKAPPRPAALARLVARLYDDRSLWRRLREGALCRGRLVPTAEEVAGRFLAEAEKACGCRS